MTDNIRFNAEIRGNFRESAQELAPLPYTPGDPFYNGFWTNPDTGATLAYSGISQDNYYLRQAIDLLDSGKARSQLGWSPRRTVQDAIGDTIAWLKRNLARLREMPAEYIHQE